MLVPNGLGSFLSKSYSNYKASFLKDTIVVVHGDDFINFILKDVIGHQDNQHNECFNFSIKACQLMEQLQKCGVQPIFIFSGYIYNTQYQLHSSNQISSMINRYKPTFVNILNHFNTAYMTSFFLGQFDAAVLSMYLNCPLIASNYDIYYLLAVQVNAQKADIIQELTYMPIHLLDFSICENESLILCHAFQQKCANLSSVKSYLRPLLSVLYSESSEIRSHICEQINCNQTKYASVTNADASLQEWQLLVDWLTNLFAMNSVATYEYVIELFDITKQPAINAYLLDCTAFHMSDFLKNGHLIASYLNLTQSNSSACLRTLAEIVNTTPNISESWDQLNQWTKSFNVNLMSKFSYPENWPVNWIEVYRRVKLSPVIINVLCQSNQSVEKSFPSVHAYAVNLRWITYCTLQGLKSRNNMEENVSIIDYAWYDETMNEITLNITPLMKTPCGSISVDEILNDKLNILFPPKMSDSVWTFSLAFTLAFWYKQYCLDDPSCADSFENSPIGLAIAICAIVSLFNFEFARHTVLENYQRLVVLIRKDVADYRGRNPPTEQSRSPETITAENSASLLAVQHIYNELQTLVSLLNYVMLSDELKSELFRFQPCWVLFPSSDLVDCFSHFLHIQLPSVRFIHLRGYWLSRLYCEKRSESKLTKLKDEFTHLVNTVASLCEGPSMLNVKPINMKEVGKFPHN
ncbi:unnamed protein product [Trichobilharzia szidati]|nr:unnamed protein product [Trichobilharzia szidati]